MLKLLLLPVRIANSVNFGRRLKFLSDYFEIIDLPRAHGARQFNAGFLSGHSRDEILARLNEAANRPEATAFRVFRLQLLARRIHVFN